MHCNFLINTGGADRAPTSRQLGETVRARVLADSGVRLEWEIKRIGAFKAGEDVAPFVGAGGVDLCATAPSPILLPESRDDRIRIDNPETERRITPRATRRRVGVRPNHRMRSERAVKVTKSWR